MRSIILAAGLGTRMGLSGKSIPKCLVKPNERTLLENQLSILHNLGIKDITIVIGEEGECWTEENKAIIRSLVDNVVVNTENKKTNNTFSLHLALRDNPLNEDILILDGDLAFDSSLISQFINLKGNFLLSKEGSAQENGNRLHLVGNKVTAVGRTVSSPLIYGGIFKIEKEHVALLRESSGKPDYYAKDTGFLLDELSKTIPLVPLVNNSWINMNTETDKEKATSLFFRPSRPFVAFMGGYTGVGKSTTAKKVARITQTDIHHSAVIRKELNLTPSTPEEADKFFDWKNNIRQEVDKKVYSLLADRAANSLKEGKNVVLDAGYFFSWQRELVYRAVQSFNPDIFAICVSCSDEAEIKRRMEIRTKAFGENPLNETPSWNTYLATKELSEPLNLDSPPSPLNVIRYDTLRQEATADTSLSPNALRIVEALRS